MQKYNAKSKWKLSGYKIQYDTHTQTTICSRQKDMFKIPCSIKKFLAKSESM